MKRFFKPVRRAAPGFTLIEILIVIGIIAILAAIVIIAINPAKQFAQARNTQRQSGVNSVLNAVGQRMADNKGIFDGDFTISGVTYHCGKIKAYTASTTVKTTALTATTLTESDELGCLVPTYIAAIPMDPSIAPGTDTGYDIGVQQNGRVMVCAKAAESESAVPDAKAICVTR